MQQAATLGSRALEDEFVDIAHDLAGDVPGRVRGDAYLARTHAVLHGAPVPWALTPKIFDGPTIALLRDAAETMGRIMDKLTRAFREDEAFRDLFGLDPELARLCCLPTGYECEIPLARVDVFLDEETGDFQFCELNTDGSAGMVTTDEVTRAVRLTPTCAEFERRHPNVRWFDVCESWVDTLLETYRGWQGPAGASAHPAEPRYLAIGDYGESVISTDDVDHFVEILQGRGVAASFVDVRDLRVAATGDGAEALVGPAGPIDCVWRRAVTGELFDKPCAGADALAGAAERGLACVVGGYRTWPVATKTVFSILWGDAAEKYLDPDELAFVRAHVPETITLSPESDLARYLGRKCDWIVKPADGYGGRGILAGLDADDDQWREAVEAAAAAGDVIQRYAPQYATPLIAGGAPAEGEDLLDATPANNMEGLYLFGGRFAGVFTRSGRANIIEYETSRFNLGCLVVD